MGRIKGTLLAFDVGAARIGVARAVVPPRIAQPLLTLPQDEELENALRLLYRTEKPVAVIVGRPRNQSGTITKQTAIVEVWVERYLAQRGVPFYWQDESLTSVAAETHLQAQGRPYTKADVDAMAASIILTDFLEAQ